MAPLPIHAATFSIDWQPIEVCDGPTCIVSNFDAALLQSVFDPASITINVLPTREVDAPDFFNVDTSTEVNRLLVAGRPGVSTSATEAPLVTWFVEDLYTAGAQLARVNESGALVATSRLPGVQTIDTWIVARGISQNLGLRPLMGGDCVPLNVQNTPGNNSACSLFGPNFTSDQIATMQASLLLTPTAVPLPAGMLLLCSALGLLWRKRWAMPPVPR
jgi:hypothetical protein